VPRESFFLTTKLDNPDQGNAEAALEASLSALGTDYLDLWLMHWPAPHTKENPPKPDHSVDWLDTWKSMEALHKKYPQKLRAIGVSNFSIKFLNRLLEVATVVPAVNQIELHPCVPVFCLISP
jgi:glycerol 2-dehydrogenase (NADP+)